MPGMKWVFYLCLSICAMGLLGCGGGEGEGEQQDPLVDEQCGTKRFEEARNCPLPADVRARCIECVEDHLAQDNTYVDICGGDAMRQSGCA
eukprot:Skav212651  [mRNA]  locus=scaffold1227:104768:105040:+ [translate_table: standard]